MRTHFTLLFAAFIGCSAFGQDKPSATPRLNRYIELMESKKPAFGVFSSVVATRNGAAMAGSGLDFVIVDLEHSPFDLSKLEGYLLGMINKAEIVKKGHLQPSVTPFIRVPAAGREQLQFVIKQVLDLGPIGTVEDAVAEVDAGLGAGLHHQDLVAAHAEAAVAQTTQLRGAQGEGLAGGVDHDEVVAGALHLGEGQVHGAIVAGDAAQ